MHPSIPYHLRKGLPKVEGTFFEPWNPLGLSEEIDGPHRARKTAANIFLLRSYRRRVYWSAFIHRSFAVYSDSDFEYQAVLERFVKELKSKAPESTRHFFYEFTPGQFTPEVKTFAEGSIVCRVRPYEFSVASFFEKLVEHRSKVQSKVREAGYLEPPNRRLQFVHVHVDESVSEQLHEPEVMKTVVDVVSNSHMERIYPVFYSRDSSLVPVEVTRNLDSVLFVGDANEQHCREKVFPGRYTRKGSPWQEHLGVMHHVPEPSLVNVHRHKFTPSERQIERVTRGEDEEQAYREFLASLAD